MTYAFSEQERQTVIRKFIDDRQKGSVKIRSFHPLVKFFGGLMFRPLPLVGKVPLSDSDVEAYFYSLIATVSGVTRTTDTALQEATDQLFACITILGEQNELQEAIIPIADWENRLSELETKVGMTTAAIDALTRILDRYRPVLDELEKDYKDKLGRIQQP